jgi:subtilisin family serine protease
MWTDKLRQSRALATILVAVLATSCSRSLPTATDRAVTRGPADDPFATVGLENQVVVTLAPGVDIEDIAAQYGATVVKTDDGRTASLRPANGQTPLALMSQLGADGRVETSEPNSWMENAEARQQSFAFDDGFGNATTYAEQPAFDVLEVDRAHDVATGRGVKVAIIDTGCDMNHPTLRSHVIAGWDFVGNDADPSEQRGNLDSDRDGVRDEAFGHGTHVAGIVHLIAPDAQLLIVRVLDSEGRGDLVNVAAGVRWAVEHGAKVINLSLGTRGEADALQDVLEEAAQEGVIIVSSAGNTGGTIDPSPDKRPGQSSSVADVAACDVNANGAAFSSVDHSHVLLSAPGIGIRSTFPGGGFKLWNGTSMSAPFVTGTAALLVEKHPDWNLEAMEARLASTATPLNDQTLPPGVKEARDFGAGMLNVGRALAPDFVPLPNQPPPVDQIRPR